MGVDGPTELAFHVLYEARHLPLGLFALLAAEKLHTAQAGEGIPEQLLRSEAG
jgi:hypothetical protein